MPSGQRLNLFYFYRQKLRKGKSLTLAERQEYRSLGQAWIQMLRALGDRKGIAILERDLKLADRDSARKRIAREPAPVDVMR